MRVEAIEAQFMSFGNGLAINGEFFLESFAHHHVVLAFTQDVLWRFGVSLDVM